MSDAKPPGDGRAAARRAVGISAHLREPGGQRIYVDVDDLSVTGFRIQSVHGLAVGKRVFLTMPSFAPMQAEVAWRDRYCYGCKFMQPLHPAVLDTIAKRYPGQL